MKFVSFVQIYFVSLFFLLLFRKKLECVASKMNIVREIPFYWNRSFFCIEQVRLIAKVLADLPLWATKAGKDLYNVVNVRVELLEVEGDWVTSEGVDLVDALSLPWKFFLEFYIIVETYRSRLEDGFERIKTSVLQGLSEIWGCHILEYLSFS